MVPNQHSGNGAGGGYIGNAGQGVINNDKYQVTNVFNGGTQNSGYAFGVGQDGAKTSAAGSNGAEGKPGAGGGWAGGLRKRRKAPVRIFMQAVADRAI